MTGAQVWIALAGAAVAGRLALAQSVEYVSPAGVRYYAQADTGAIARAESVLAREQGNVNRFIELGLAQAAASQYREAIVTYTRALALTPGDALLYRYRGHRYISVRQLDSAVADLERGAWLDSTNQDIWYHLGVARFARGEFDAAARAFTRSRATARNTEGRISSTDWLWMSLSRAGRRDEARSALEALTDTVPEAGAAAYWRRLRLYRGQSRPEQVLTSADTNAIQVATLAYGVGNWYLVNGDTARAREWFRRVTATTGWQAFGFIVAERELARLGDRR
ncbi:MAG: tetratricopeptide repeat protein [Gemmatimonadetes bacterium]|nr:tetratricopeptide repeat protein [Gemmatimonadota bacterium]